MPLTEKETELVQMRQRVMEVEKGITTQFQLFEKRERIPYAFNEDFCQRSLSLRIYFDQFNLSNMDTIMEKLKALIVQHRDMRNKEAQLAQEIREEKVMQGSIATGWQQHA